MRRLRFSLGKKAVIGILIMAFILSGMMIMISYTMYSSTMDQHYRQLSMNVAQTTAHVVNAEDIKRYKDEVYAIYSKNPAPKFKDEKEEQAYLAQFEGIKDDKFKVLYDTLDKIKKDNQVLSLYIVYMDPETMTSIYIIDADNSSTACPPGTWDIIYEQNYEAMKAPEKGFPSYITNTEEFGWLSTAGAAIINDEGEVVGHVMVDISMNDVMNQRHEYLFKLILLLFFITFILLLIYIYVIHKKIVKPINILSSATSQFVNEQKNETVDSSIEALNIKTGDEIEILSNSIQQMQKDILEYIHYLTKITGERERMHAELDVAKNIQASMLPINFPQCESYELYAMMTPAKEVGGDFYDFFFIDENHLALVIADVSGKGIPAAMFMVVTKTLIKNITKTNMNPSAILQFVNKQLCENNDEEMFVTAWIGILDVKTGVMKCSNAGHEYPILRNESGNFELLKDKHGFVLGGMEFSKYRDYEIQLHENDAIFVYTDGVTEATNINNELYGTQRLLKILNENNKQSCEHLLLSIQEDIRKFVGNADQFDDITMLAFQYKTQNTLTVEPNVHSLEEMQAFIKAYLEKHDVSKKIQTKAAVIIDELYSNIMYYSKATKTTVSIAMHQEDCVLTIKDNGMKFNPFEQDNPDIDREINDKEEGGLGIYMVKQMAKSYEYQHIDCLNQVIITISI